MSSTSIRLGPNDGRMPSREDLSRAFFCSAAVYESSNERAEILLQNTQRDYPTIKFAKVHMSLDLFGEHKFLVAYAEDAIFIAFRGTTTLEDVATNLKFARDSRFGGAFHYGFFKRSDIFFKPDCNPILGLLSLQKRIIFCGHSLGGAVAHMVLFRLFVEDDGKFKYGVFPDSFISIAFGAPHVCDEDAARKINEDKNLRWRFTNFVNQSDPVPCLLHSIPHTVAVVAKSLESNENVQNEFALQGIGTLLGRCLDGYAQGGFLRGASAALIATFDIGMSKIANKSKTIFAKHLLRLAQRAAPRPGTSKYNKPDFYPIGYYIFVERQSDEWRDGDRPRFNVHRINDKSADMRTKLEDVHFGLEDLERHEIRSYKSVLIESNLMDSPQVPSIQYQMNNVVSTPTPIITMAQSKMVDSTQPYITITGENLLFLIEPIKINDMETWVTTKQEDNEIVVLRPSSLNENSKIDISFLTVKTAFGQGSKIVMEGFLGNPPTIARKLAKIVVIMMIMKDFGTDPSPDHLSKLDEIIQCAPGLQGKKLSPILIEGCIQEANNMTKAVADFLLSGLLFSYEDMIGKWVNPTVNGIVPYSTICSGIIPQMIIAGCVAGTVTYGAIAVTRFIVDDYKKILVIGCEEASKWSTSEPTLHVDTNLELASLEEELQNQVERSTNNFKGMVQEAHLYPNTTMRSNFPQLKHKYAKNSDPKCRINLLKRIKIIVNTSHLFSQVVGQKQFWGILGAEDAGKSTFIMKALDRFGPRNPPRLPRCGRSFHTSIVEPYKLADSVWLVDFPGRDGLQGNAEKWIQFKELPNSCILVLQFLGDIKSGQRDMYQEVKERLSTSEIKVVFNKVDMIFQPGEEDDEADYFERQKENSAEQLGCPKDNIYYACFNPRCSNERMRELKELGVLGFEDFFQELGILEGHELT
ncbi:unnamed protein product [Sphagnum compactum]